MLKYGVNEERARAAPDMFYVVELRNVTCPLEYLKAAFYNNYIQSRR